MQTNDELIGAVLNGQPAAFAELVRRYERPAWLTAWRVLRDFHAAQDATQDAFVEAYRRLGQLRDRQAFGYWLLRIAQRSALRLARKRRPAHALDPESHAAQPIEAPAINDELLLALGALPEHERLVVSLRYLNNLSVAEVARLSGRPVGTVTKQLSRALERLRSAFREVSHEPGRSGA